MADISKEKDFVGGEGVEPIYIELAGKINEQDPKYTPLILKKAFTLEEAKIVRELPAPAEEIAKKLNLKKEAVEKTLKELVKKGCLLQTKKGPKLFSWAPQFCDIFSANPAHDKERGEECFQWIYSWLWPREYSERILKNYEAAAAKDGHVLMRVIPRWRAIKDIPGVMPSEDMREILRAYEGKLNTTRCICRPFSNPRHSAIHEGTIPSEGNCIHFGNMAEYYTEVMEITPYLTVEKILEKLDRLDISPIYHMGPNKRDVDFICNCDEFGCGVAAPVRRYRGDEYLKKLLLSPSRFLCTVDTGKCTGSKVCVTKCPFHALEIKNGKAQIDTEKCFGCGTCVINCPSEALKLKLVRPPEHIPEQGISIVELMVLELVELK